MIAFLAQWLGESYSYQMGLSVIAFLETLSGVAVFIFPLKHKPQYVVRATAGIALMAAIMKAEPSSARIFRQCSGHAFWVL